MEEALEASELWPTGVDQGLLNGSLQGQMVLSAQASRAHIRTGLSGDFSDFLGPKKAGLRGTTHREKWREAAG